MPVVRLHYDGWLSLLAEVRQHLQVTTGDRLEVELANGAVLLRPAKQAAPTATPQPVKAVTAPPALLPELPATVTARRGRPPKPMAEALSSSVKVGSRRKGTPLG